MSNDSSIIKKTIRYLFEAGYKYNYVVSDYIQPISQEVIIPLIFAGPGEV